MPNHVTTVCTVHGDNNEVARFAAKMLRDDDGESCFDFNQILPMPEAAKETEEGSVGNLGQKLVMVAERLPHNERLTPSDIDYIRKRTGLYDQPIEDVAKVFLQKNPEYDARGRLRNRCRILTGFSSWYDWALANWGTKWNSYSLTMREKSPLSFEFNTAWSFPSPVFEALAHEFPHLRFECICFDEGWNFAGHGFFNPSEDDMPFHECEATNELYEAVYGVPYTEDD